ncbi:MAG: hypothetical protein ABI867_11090, partial [Kofleriaceae bacterium]
VAPGMIPTPQWLPLAFGNVPPDQITIGLVLRLYNQVLGMLSKGREVMIPEAEDEDACIAFASGYVAAATLDLHGSATRRGGPSPRRSHFLPNAMTWSRLDSSPRYRQLHRSREP